MLADGSCRLFWSQSELHSHMQFCLEVGFLYGCSMQASSNAAGSCECTEATGAQLLITHSYQYVNLFKAHSTEPAAHLEAIPFEAMALLLCLPAGRHMWQHLICLSAASTTSLGSPMSSWVVDKVLTDDCQGMRSCTSDMPAVVRSELAIMPLPASTAFH